MTNCCSRPQGEMTIWRAAESKRELLAVLGDCEGKDIELDLSDVQEMDTAGFQLLLLLKREAIRAGKNLRIVGHSQAVLNVLDTYRMAAYFGDPVVLPSSGKA